ncbi:response regulator [Neptuniibacter sp. CAU 1671]|uniref:response regulator n=1 Tax=Neptuniibacter sp. CAU 1671 TaxID=3032593 RepID=UPI0023DA2433|nr:response regulator [Neptuniibacter sp. CAU 1671]MDF2181963.1 response regulator [Neptuniibacter sp. CAU 1671]
MKPVKVIIVEDDRQIAEIQRRFLEKISGFELVGIAHGLAQAEDLVEVFRPDLLLLDIQFPDGTGLDLLRRLRAANSEVDVILITAAKEVDTLREAMRGGVFDYILKPLVFERLQEALNNYREHLSKLHAMQSLAQKDVDTLLPRSAASAPETTVPSSDIRLPKGVDALTLEKVRMVFSEQSGSLSAEEVGSHIGASRTTARRYLEYLVSTQELEAEVAYGSVGRPERRYHGRGVHLN